MNKQFYLFTLFIFYLNQLTAQTNYGARLTAMGNSGAAVQDAWGVAGNPATISKLSNYTAQLSHTAHQFSKEIRNQGLTLVFPMHKQTFGLGLQRYGIPEYHIIKAGIVAGRQFGPKLAIGIRANYHQLKIENYGLTTGISIDAGTVYQVSDALSVGFYMDNLSKQRYRSSIINTTIPATAFVGIAYQTSKKLLLATTIKKDDVAIGMDYHVIPVLSLRGGLSLNPYMHYFGVGFNAAKFLVDFAFSKHPNLGYSPQLTIGYVF